jgi:predicted anti-sigma-YlaC factor YlaD
MDCAAAREEMLGADLDELRGSGDTPLAEHLRACAKCRARADVIVAGHALLATSLAGLKPAADNAGVTRLHKARGYRWVPLPLAAAAIIALLFVGQQGDEALPNMDAVTRLMFRETPVVSPTTGQQAMVIEKNNMTIVWLYKGEIQ